MSYSRIIELQAKKGVAWSECEISSEDNFFVITGVCGPNDVHPATPSQNLRNFHLLSHSSVHETHTPTYYSSKCVHETPVKKIFSTLDRSRVTGHVYQHYPIRIAESWLALLKMYGDYN